MPRTLNIPRRSMKEIVDGQPGNVAADLEETKVETPAPETVETPAIDAEAEAGQSSEQATQPTEGERELAQRIAKRMGWAPKEEWKRDPTKWEDEFQFLDRTPTELVATRQRNAELAERAKRAAQAAEAAFEEDRRRLLAEAEAKVRAAANAKDPEAAAAAAREVAAHSGPHPKTAAWIARNSWFNEDQGAQAVAVTAIRKAEAAGFSIEDQLEAGEMAARKRFPEYFGAAETTPVREAPKEEIPLSQVRRPPVVQTPSRTTQTTRATTERGFADIPSAMRQQFEQRLQRLFTNRGLTVQQAQDRYAKSYWAENPS